MAELERDKHSGYLTTGHEWNGIKELNSPVPWVVWFFIAVTHLWALVYWVLMPSWPLLTTYTKGLLRHSDRVEVTESLRATAQGTSAWKTKIASASYEALLSDDLIMARARDTGRTLFGDNCAGCHGREARGTPRFPDLTTDSWLWGGSPQDIAETIRVGINSPHPQTRVSQMLAFGKDGMLKRDAIDNVIAYIVSLRGASPDATTPAILAGKTIFSENCASCHGVEAKGNPGVGAPDLTGNRWIYGKDSETLYETIWGGRRGYMPSWQERLSDVERKILVLYLIDLRTRRR